MAFWTSLFHRGKNASNSKPTLKQLKYLRQKSENSVLTKEEAEDFIRLAQALKVSLTPRETLDIQKAISNKPPPSEWKTSMPLHRVRAGVKRKPSNEIIPVPQKRSHLFHLPLEIRHEIWRLALGGSTIHLATRKCYVVQEDDIQEPYWRHKNHLLSVALLCRQSYLESITLLYSENTFAVGFGSGGGSYIGRDGMELSGTNEEFFKQIHVDLRPKCVAAIRSLKIGFHLSEGYSQYYDAHPQAWDLSLHIRAPCSVSGWANVFKAVTELKGLKELVVVVWASGSQRHRFRAHEEEMMKIPATMKGLNKFEIWLPWEQDPSIKDKLIGEMEETYVVKRDYQERERFGVNVPNYKFDS
ncbi:hypothetical protein F5Y16DRAFT_362371 [Xylariaceae sp. FL0255]|nr:hypothetical protein F5Y16DRAFT_362371 [Xylariaceae sp. FL0255]